MNWLRNLAVMTLALLLTNTADAAGKAKKKAKPIKGEVTEVKKDQDKDSGSLIVKVAANKKTGAAATDKTFKVTTETKVLKLDGKKAKTAATTPAKFGDIQKGDKVTLTAKDDSASEIKVAAKKKAKKAKKAK